MIYLYNSPCSLTVVTFADGETFMSDGTKTNDNGSPASKNEATGTYESSTDALKEISGAFDYWSGQVTATSLQMCYGLIAANWVVFGSVGNILHSRYAIVSLFLVLLALTFNMLSAYGLAEYMRNRFGYAVYDRNRWEAEFQHEKIKPTTWPYAKWTEGASIATRAIKIILPLASGVCLIIGAVIYRPVITSAPAVLTVPSFPADSVKPPKDVPAQKP
jgi:hypothetical protein